MNQISALPNPLEILFQEYNQGRIESVGFRSFTLHTDCSGVGSGHLLI